MHNIHRRHFLKAAGAATAGLVTANIALNAYASSVAPNHKRVNPLSDS